MSLAKPEGQDEQSDRDCCFHIADRSAAGVGRGDNKRGVRASAVAWPAAQHHHLLEDLQKWLPVRGSQQRSLVRSMHAQTER